MEKDSQIICPHCHKPIDVNSVLSSQIEDRFKEKYQHIEREFQQKAEAEKNKLTKEREEFERKKQQENQIFQEKLETKLRDERIVIEKNLRSKINEEQSQAIGSMQQELKEKTEQLKELNLAKIEIERIKREKEALKEQITAESEKALNQKLTEEKEKVRKLEQEKHELRIKELQKQLEDQKHLTEEMKRKQEQGSMQLQGEVQELAIEEWLSINFPWDTISEIKKGARGADCLQTVRSNFGQECGIIYYESKRTKDFQHTWIEKFKADMREKNANVGVLVTEVLPTGMDRMDIKDGIWICTYEEFKGLSKVLREHVILLYQASASQENKGDKMHMLYDYLISNTFKFQIEAIVEGFVQMQSDLDKEKRSMAAHWKAREKQLDKVITNTIGMYGSIKGIAGNALPTIKTLELPEGNND